MGDADFLPFLQIKDSGNSQDFVLHLLFVAKLGKYIILH